MSWDDALDDIACRLKALIAEHGAGTLASMIGGPHTSFWPLHRFMTLVGSPNNMGIGQICWNPRIWMDVLTFGWTVEADLTPETGCMVLWGTNPAESDNSAFWRAILQVGKSDTPLVVIDPRFTKTARLADLWIAPKPGTDCALALGLINVIIAGDLVDRDFVDAWCSGYDELVEHVAAYAPSAWPRFATFPPMTSEEPRACSRAITRPFWFPAAESIRWALRSPRRIAPSAACAPSPATSTGGRVRARGGATSCPRSISG